MKVAAVVAVEGLAMILSTVLEDTAGTLGLIAATLLALGVIGKAAHKTYNAWRGFSGEVRSAVRKLDALDDQTIAALKCLPDWHKGMDLRMAALEDRFARRRAS